jgi:hypothetical protein
MHIEKHILMSINHIAPVIDIYPWSDGLSFTGGKEWWSYVARQPEVDKLDLLIMMAHLNETICRLLLAHDKELLDRFHFSDCTLEQLSAIQANSLIAFVTLLGEQNSTFKGDFQP